MLEKDTPLSRFLAGKGIKFDVEKKKISIQGMDIDIFRYTNDHQSHSNEYDQFSPKYREAIDRIYIKLYSDKSEIEVFLCGKDSELEKYPYITRHPEFLHNIDNLLKAMQIPPTLSKEWSELQNGQYYILEFDVCIHFLEYILDSIYPDSIYDEKPSFEIFENYFDLLGYTRKHFLSNKVPNDFYYNIFLVKNSLELFFTGKGKEYGQILPTTKILPSDLRITQKSTI